MTIPPDNIRSIIRSALNSEPSSVQPIRGGMINQSARVEVNGTRYFVKWNASAPPSFFDVEARGLNRLRTTGAFRVPEVIFHSEAADDSPAYLILEWIEGAGGRTPRTFTADVGRRLAVLHRVRGSAFGLEYDNYIGTLRQENTPSASWPQFYRDRRIAVQVEIARRSGYLPPRRETMLRDVMGRIETILDGAGSVPSLLHGDLWSGNYFAADDGQPAVVDPAVYYGDREVEIAFTGLFGGFPAGFLEAYQEAYPLQAGHQYRRPLLQLYPMLVHLNHFGESYGDGVENICRYYL
jgi:fructosamine-3-kinase